MTTFRVEPAFAESLAWRTLRRRADGGRPEALTVHHERAAELYAQPAAPTRERAFERLAAQELGELEVMAPLAAALDERPGVAAAVDLVLVGEAPAAVVEGITCDPARRRIGVSVQARRFDDPAGLRAWARHALGHTEDAIDPDFGFEPGWDGLPGRGRFAERLHALWDVSIDTRAEALHESAGSEGRMARRRTAHAGAIAGLWPELAGDAAAIVERLWSGPRPSFPELRRWAEEPTALAAATGATLSSEPRQGAVAGICPLCRFPSATLDLPSPAIAALVAAEFPDRRPDDRLCDRCADRYRFAQLGGVA